MRSRWLQFLSVVLLAGSAIAIGAPKVKVEFNHNANFVSYHSFEWLKPAEAPGQWAVRITSLVNHQLEIKGLTPSPSNPDLIVAAVGLDTTQPDLNSFYRGTGGWHWQEVGTAKKQISEFRKGSVVVDLFDARTKQLIWRGIATDTVSGTPEKNLSRFNREMTKMFKLYPPLEPGQKKR